LRPLVVPFSKLYFPRQPRPPRNRVASGLNQTD
jgi:hypothetical protein